MIKFCFVVFLLCFSALAEDYAPEFWVVESVRFKGIFPLFISDIERPLNIRRGSLINDSIIEIRVGELRQIMENLGLKNVECRIEAEKNPETGSVSLTIIKDHSENNIVRAIRFEGNRYFSDRQLFRAFNGRKYRNRRLNRVELPSDIRNLREKYLEHNFADVAIRDTVVQTIDGRSEIIISVDEGRKYSLSIENRGVLRRGVIRNELDFSNSNRNDRIIRTGRRNLENKLLGMGYYSGKLEISDTTISKRRRDERRVSVWVKAGDRISLDEINFSGNEFFTDEELLQIMQSEVKGKRIARSGEGSFVARVVRNDGVLIENRYFENGFLNAEVKTTYRRAENSAVVNISITEGVRTIISNAPFPDTPFNPSAVDSSVQNKRNALIEDGFANAKVSANLEFSADSSEVEINFDVDKGERIFFGNIEFIGNFKTRDEYINRFFRIEEGDVFSNRALFDNLRQTRKINAFRSVYSITTPNGDTNDISLFFEEVYPFLLNFSVGYNNEQRVYSRVKLTNRNFLGLNKTLSVGAGISVKEYYGEVNFTDPFFFNEKLSFNADLYSRWNEVMERKFWSRAIGSGCGISFSPNSKLNFGMGLNYETRYLYPFKNYAYNEFDTSDVVDLSLINELRHVVLISPNASFDFRDSKIRPRIGGVISTQFTASHGFNSLQDDFVKAEADVRFFLPVSKFTTLALRGAGGKAMPYGKNDKVAMDRLFSIGGTRTVRGFREGELWLTNDGYPILGYSALYYSAELRSALGNIEIPIFADFGTITDKNNADFKPIKYSVGGGINYITPIGPIGLSYAVPIDNESRKRNSEANRTGIPGVIHFSIGYSF